MLLVSFLGVFIGLVMGLTGAGGGILAVPALVVGLGFSMTSAAPVALMAVGISALVGTLDGLSKKIVRYKAALLMAILGALFSHLGITLAHIIPDLFLMTLFSAIMLLVAWRMFRQARQVKNPVQPGASELKPCVLNPTTGKLHWTRRCASTLAGIGAVTGLFAGMLGVGGGFIIVPAFKRYTNIDMHSIVATSLAVIALVSMSTVAGIVLHGTRISGMGWNFVGAAVAGMVLGRLASPHIPSRLLQIGFSGIATLVAVIMLIKTYWPATFS
ncbi:sulfite exporter TauE/SafE family protein [Paralcaligenes ginsengisoli]